MAKHDPGTRRSAVVVAHPDDEILWLSSVVGSAARLVFCFGDPLDRPRIAAGRRNAVARIAALAPVLDLAVPESGAGFCVDWSETAPTSAGVAINEEKARARYEGNAETLDQRLATVLDGFTDVYTHNPWGEYGHAEHVQVHRVLATLAPRLGFRLWYSNYVGPKSWPFAHRLAASLVVSGRETRPTDRRLARLWRDIYRQHGAWTWHPGHRWPAAETMFAAAPGAGRATLAGARLLDISRLRLWSPPWPSPRRTLPTRPDLRPGR